MNPATHSRTRTHAHTNGKCARAHAQAHTMIQPHLKEYKMWLYVLSFR